MVEKENIDITNIIEDKNINEENTEIITKEELCKTLYILPNSIAVDFKGYGIEIPLENKQIDENLKEIKVYYTEDIGNPDFKYYVKLDK